MKIKKEDRTKLNTKCICPEIDCDIHGNCIECQKYHHKIKEKSYCGK
jgi:hypothetical protein